MPKKRLLIIGIVVIAAVVLWLVLGRGDGQGENRYEFAEIERGDLENIISSTGTLSPVGMVEVGTQVSGTIEKVLVNYNEGVRRGQVLAVLDTTMLAASVRDGRANVLKAEALYRKAEIDNDRSIELYERELISESEIEEFRANTMSFEASLLSAKASLDRARANLNYAVIRSPIDGKVIARNVEPGQTVAASFSTPTLFVIAEDLAEMEILAYVDESDIGQITEGQTVRFTVEAYFEQDFHGIVREVRLLPQTVQNVVNYTVVVDATNEEGLLFPGMTATADFLIEEREDVLLVTNAALRLRPTMGMLMEMKESMQKRMEAMPDSVRERVSADREKRGEGGHASSGGWGQGGGHPGGGFGSGMELPEGVGRLWHLDENGRLGVTQIVKGATDGRTTEIVSGDVEEGMSVITGVTEEEEEQSGSRNPLATSMRRGGRKKK